MPKPARRRRDDDEDDDDDDDDDDDRPRRGRARYEDDDEDDRPRRRGRTRDDDEEEDDDRPRRGRRRDGLPPGTPRVYVHIKCGEATEMPADVVRTYLANPFAYGPQTYCSACEKVVPWEKCEWEETGENLLDYFEDLQARALLAGRDPRRAAASQGLVWMGPVAGLLVLGVAGAVVGGQAGLSPLLAGLAGGALGTALGFLLYYRDRRSYERAAAEYDKRLFESFYDRHPDERPRKGGR